MGLFEGASSPQDMFWYGSSEGAYDPSSDSSPTMPHLHHDPSHYPPFPPHPHHLHPPHPHPLHLPPHNPPPHPGSPYLPLPPNMPPSHPHHPATPHHDHQPPLTPSSGGSSSSASTPSGQPGGFCTPPADTRGAQAPQFMSPGSDGRNSAGMTSPVPISLQNSELPNGGGGSTTTSGCNGAQTALSSASTVTSGQVSTAVSSGPGVEVCAGCSERILDRFYLLAVDKKWHAGCLRCVTCKIPLDTPRTLFTRDGLIFCKEDYHRMFGSVKCARCSQPFIEAQMVMRVKELVYHYDCFTCDMCNARLNKGDRFGIAGTLIYCSEHFQVPGNADGGHISPLNIPPQGGMGYPTGPMHPPLLHPGPLGVSGPPIPPEGPMGGFPSSGQLTKLQVFNNGGACSPSHKGRTKKRKPKEEPMDTNISEYYIPSGYDLEAAYGPMTGQPVRSKRIRTSFKHHQLRTMRSYFDINHNPDAKDLKALSQKTSLSKRVLQVWFQNARAKWRRQVSNKDPKALQGSAGDGGVEAAAMTSDSQEAISDGGGPGGPGSDYGPSTPMSNSGAQAMSPGDDEESRQSCDQNSSTGLESIF